MSTPNSIREAITGYEREQASERAQAVATAKRSEFFDSIAHEVVDNWLEDWDLQPGVTREQAEQAVSIQITDLWEDAHDRRNNPPKETVFRSDMLDNVDVDALKYEYMEV